MSHCYTNFKKNTILQGIAKTRDTAQFLHKYIYFFLNNTCKAHA